MKSYNVDLIFIYGTDGRNKTTVTIETPNNVGMTDVKMALENDHTLLSGFWDHHDKSDTNVYAVKGRNQETLVEYTCKRRKWKWRPFKVDGSVTFE